MNSMTLKMSEMPQGTLSNTLDPTYLRTLKKRLIKGQISPESFKHALKRLMIAQFFDQYSHPIEELGRKIKGILFMELKNPWKPTQPESDAPEELQEIEGYLVVPQSKNLE